MHLGAEPTPRSSAQIGGADYGAGHQDEGQQYRGRPIGNSRSAPGSVPPPAVRESRLRSARDLALDGHSYLKAATYRTTGQSGAGETRTFTKLNFTSPCPPAPRWEARRRRTVHLPLAQRTEVPPLARAFPWLMTLITRTAGPTPTLLLLATSLMAMSSTARTATVPSATALLASSFSEMHRTARAQFPGRRASPPGGGRRPVCRRSRPESGFRERGSTNAPTAPMVQAPRSDLHLVVVPRSCTMATRDPCVILLAWPAPEQTYRGGEAPLPQPPLPCLHPQLVRCGTGVRTGCNMSARRSGRAAGAAAARRHADSGVRPRYSQSR